jgi:plasmid maintenance system killer protein
MIQSFAHKGLKELFATGASRRVRPDLWKRCAQILDALNAAADLSELALPDCDCIRTADTSQHVGGWT